METGMNEKNSTFRQYREAAWDALRQVFRAAGAWDGQAVRIRQGPFVITLDIRAFPAGYTSRVATRLRAAFHNRDRFRFRVTRHDLLSDLAEILGAQDLRLGNPVFDREFVLKSAQPEQLLRLLDDSDLQSRIASSAIQLIEVRPDEGWFGPEFPEGVDELYLEAAGRIVVEPDIEYLFEVFSTLLNRLCHIGSAYEEDPRLTL